jgi:hypothetical protein
MDWITTFMSLTANTLSPEPFRLWSGLATLSAALERRIFTRTKGVLPARPNLYICLAGASGSGKSEAINLARSLLTNVKGLHMAPANTSAAAFYDVLKRSARITSANGATAPQIFHSLTICCREWGTFFPHYEGSFLSDLSDLYDNPPTWESERRTSTTVNIDAPTINVLIGVTPKTLGEFLPEMAWGQGFCSRMIFIHGFKGGPTEGDDMFKANVALNTTVLRSRLGEIFDLSGEVEWSERARKELNAWWHSGCPPLPQHGRLVEYNTRRPIHILKLAMVSAVSAGRDLFVDLEDFERAQSWLLEAEDTMPDVFRAMSTKSDHQVLKELHYHMYAAYGKVSVKDRKPIPESDIYKFLSEKVESHRIKNMIETAEKLDYIKRALYPGEWIPNPLV